METRQSQFSSWMGRMLLLASIVAVLAAGPVQPAIAGTQIDIAGPPGSGAFGTSVTVLPNGNIVIADPYYDAGAVQDVGAVYLYDGASGALISTLTGSTAYDQIGYSSDLEAGVTVLSNGNYVVCSRYWDNGAAADAGAVTWGSATTGVSGVASAANSLVGSTADDQVGGFQSVTALSNGNYVVRSRYWDNGTAVDAGAVTWGSGTVGVQGEISAANSLVGSTADDQIGWQVMFLTNDNYVVVSPYWNNGAVVNAGAATWGDGTVGVSGTVSEANSLVGTAGYEYVGVSGGTALNNGNYVIVSYNWHNGAGAVTWGNGSAGVAGPVSAANSLVGSTSTDAVGYGNVVALSNGNYVVITRYWDNGSAVDAGAVTWGDGATGTVGVVSAANSLVGSTAGDQVGCDDNDCSEGVIELSNGNYVVRSPDWDNGASVDAGAATWGSGTAGVSGEVSAVNSLVGTKTGDEVSNGGVTALNNGNYVVRSNGWDNGAAASAGAVTWANGAAGTSGQASRIGPVSAANSLVGSTALDRVGAGVVTPLANGNYVVNSPYWDNGTATDAGAVTWGNGMTGIAGPVSVANSLVGSTAGDGVGTRYGVTVLSNGNYVVHSPDWDNGGVVDAGAVTWGSGTSGVRGVVSEANSLVGSTWGDNVGMGLWALSNGNYVTATPVWDNGALPSVGAVTWGNGSTGTTGPVSAANSLVGGTAQDSVGEEFELLSNGNYVVGSPRWDNGAATSAGAVTWGNGMSGIAGVVSAANSLVGSTAGDGVGGTNSVTPLGSGHYVVKSTGWDNGTIVNAGAVTWSSGLTGVAGPITVDNSVLGTADNGGESMVWAYDKVNHQLVVGRPADNIVTLFRLEPIHPVFLPVVLKHAP